MANHNLLKKLKFGITTILAFIFIFCMSAFFLTGCGADETDEETKAPSYTYTDGEDGVIANADFTKGTASKEFKAYPIASPSGWSKSYNDSAISSYVDSGVIDVSTGEGNGWETLSAKLKEDTDLLECLSYQEFGSDSKTSQIKENFNDYFANPGARPGAVDGKVYMLNNYPSNAKYIGKGTAQSLTSSSSIKLEKGKIAKISVWVYTLNITGHGDPADRGANITITNSINGISQGDFKLNSIVSDKVWTQYEIYVQADSNYNSELKIVLGLGYGSGKNTATKYYTQGTVFFDDIAYEEVDSIPTNAIKTSMELGKEEDYLNNVYTIQQANTDPQTVYSYDMTINGLNGATPITNFSGLGTNGFFTESNISGKDGKFTSKDIAGDTVSKIEHDGHGKFTLSQASASIKTEEIELNRDSFALVSFKIDNQLKLNGSTEITFDVYDVLDSTKVKRAAIYKIEDPTEESIVCNLLIKNNFEDVDRKFFLVINIGPNDLTSVETASELANGVVTISDMVIVKDTQPSDDEENTIYSFVSGTATATVNLYAGYSQDYVEEPEDTTTYSLSTRPSDFGTIINAPANVKDYDGVSFDHSYINGSNVIDLNNKTTAGLINTKYLSNYDAALLPNLSTAVGSFNDDVQPLMIYNNSADSYGYIGEKIEINSSAAASFSVKVRVVGDAVAYIYLVDVSKVEKKVLTFNDFTPNASVAEKTQGTVNGTTPVMLKVDKNTMGDDEWVTINFYIATGATSKSVRLEMWNGSRDGQAKSTGYVFFDEVTTKTSDAFKESSTWEGAFDSQSHPLFNVVNSQLSASDQLIAYKRPLTETEIQFNDEYKNSDEYEQVKYYENYIWAKTSTLLYAVYNTIDPVEVDPYDQIKTEENEGGDCTAKSDPATFWLSFSSILLGVVLVLAIIALFVKMHLRRRKANKNDAKSHYKVTSRIRSQRELNKKKEEEIDDMLDYKASLDSEIQEDSVEENQEEQTPAEEQNLDEYVYGEVIEDFAEEEKDETPSSDDEEKPSDN
ncbi:MAG: hypothetical protein IKB98_01455 [Clostridia bacterium]|nr:hypothetical protein [Clostridia bacterium]